MIIAPLLQVARKWGKGAEGGQQDETLDYSAPTPSGSEADLQGLAADMSKASLVDQEEGEEDDSDEGEPPPPPPRLLGQGKLSDRAQSANDCQLEAPETRGWGILRHDSLHVVWGFASSGAILHTKPVCTARLQKAAFRQ